MSDWTHNGEIVESIPEGCTNFVYLITNLVSGKKYVGKKSMYSTVTRPPLKGQKRNRKITKESDWKKYFGSNDEIKSDVKELGVDSFSREILHWCGSKAVATYLEAKEQFDRDVLLRKDFYNSWIDITCNASHLKEMYIN